MRGLRVAIVGGGIGGLTAALALRRGGHEPVVLEQTREIRAVGAGISLWPNGVKVLNLLGLGAALDPLGGHMARMAYTWRDGRDLVDFPLDPLYDRVGERARPLARADLQGMLLDAVGADGIRLGTRVTSVDDDDGGGPVVVHTTTDGGSGHAVADTVEADVVVAADGTHSHLRDHVVGRAVERRYVGYVNWNGLLVEDPAVAPVGTWRTWVGDGRRASVMPIGAQWCYAWLDVPMALDEARAEPASLEVLASHFTGWASEVAALIAGLDPGGVARIPIHDTDPLERWVHGRVALLGDAAHSMAPDLGQGGCQAIEDAWVLAHHLTATGRSVGDALTRYQAERMPHTAAITTRARRRADAIHGADPEATAQWYRSLERDGPDGIIDGLAQSVETGPCR